ncbi:MAG: peptide deformylase [bacterium]|nr:peptide deformylase [bacterium]
MNELRIYPDPILRNKAREIKDFDPEKLQYVIQIMEEVIKEHEAVGIAAPQIGILEQIILANRGDGCISIINPKIVESKGNDILEEGCLSLPGVGIEITRPNFVVIKGIDEYGKEKIIQATDLLARVLQHEIDHLNGILIIDKLSPVERVKFDIGWRRREYEKRPPSRIL